MKIRMKITLGFILIAGIGLALGVTGLVSVRMLSDMSHDLKSMQSTSQNIIDVLNAHHDWRNELTEAVLGGDSKDFTGSLDPNACALGTWLASDDAKGITDVEVLSLLQQIEEPHKFIHTEAVKVVDFMNEGELDEARRFLMEDILPKLDDVTTMFGKVEERYTTLSDNLVEKINAIENELNGLLVALLIVALVLCMIVAVILTQWIVNKIHWYENVLDNIPFLISVTDEKRNWTFVNKSTEDTLGMKRSQMIGKPCSNWGANICNTDKCGVNCLECGQGSTTFEQTGRDFKVDVSYLLNIKGKKMGHIEVVQDISDMVKMQKAETALVEDINQISASFVAGSQQVSDVAQVLAQGTTEQAAAIQELSSSIAEIEGRTKANAVKAEQAAKLVDEIKNNAEKGSLQMNEMLIAVKDINEASKSINKVLKTIDDIAFQTNILALNAAVEAARAGEFGKGFAVVAEEVRSLASKSAEAAKDTGSLIMDSIDKAELGVGIADETAEGFTKIVIGINESGQLVGDIARLTEEQSASISQINVGMDQVSQVVQTNSATAEEGAATSEEITSQANTLEELIMRFHKEQGDGDDGVS